MNLLPCMTHFLVHLTLPAVLHSGDQPIKPLMREGSPSSGHFHIGAEMIHFSKTKCRYLRSRGQISCPAHTAHSVQRQERRGLLGVPGSPSAGLKLRLLSSLGGSWKLFLSLVHSKSAANWLSPSSAGFNISPPWVHSNPFLVNDLVL